jgi:serine/threonine-protein kinase
MVSDVNGYKTKEEWFLGKGTFGSVYKAEKDGKFFAVKIFQTEFLKDEYKKFLDREIQALQKIDHPNVVKLYEYGTFKDKGFDYFYIVMDFVEGNRLSAYIGTAKEKTIVDLIKSILSTLDYVHHQGIFHRDLKPDNIMVNVAGEPVLLDFGLSKLIDYTSIIQTGEHAGTYSYMSPEQIVDSKNIDARSDYFSVGVILYQLLTGIKPFDAPNVPALINLIQNQYPKAPSDLNPAISNQVENVILKLLEKQPFARYQTISEIIGSFDQTTPIRERKLDLNIKNYIRVLNNEKELFKDGQNKSFIEAVLYPANLFKRFHPTVKLIVDSRIPFTTDPATNRLNYPAFTNTNGIQELPYSSGDETTPLQKKDFHSITQIQEYVKKVLDFQISNGVNELAAPFFYAKDPTDEWFSINLKLLKESIAYRDKERPTLPLWGGICMSVDGWHDDEIKNEILNKYVKNAPDGFFVYGDPIGSTANLPQIFHYSDLLKKLQDSSGVPVIAARVNGLGLVLLAIGIAGISSGIAGLDSFKESLLSDMRETDFGVEPRYYIPELMTMVSLKGGITTKLKDIAKSSIAKELKCRCTYCSGAGGETLSVASIKMHFLLRRHYEVKELEAVSSGKRLDFIENKINKAIQYQKILQKEGIKIANDFSHLNTWKTLVEKFKKIS